MVDLFTFNKEIFYRKLRFACSAQCVKMNQTQKKFTCSKSTIKTLEKRVKYVQS